VERLLPLEGGRNFRDLGGYTTEDGRRVRWRRLFRSGVLSYLTDRDHYYLKPLGIRVICDLRSQGERDREPLRWYTADFACLHWDDHGHHTRLRQFLKQDFSAQLARDAMLSLYKSIPLQFEAQYAALFRCLAAGSLPLVFNCAAGKDRTGVAAALVLASLGIPRDQIMQDFKLTDEYLNLDQVLFEHPTGSIGLGEDRSFLAQVTRRAREPLLKADPLYLEAAFAQIEQEHGSVLSYIRRRLGVNEDGLCSIRTHLLED
jgi:protein-tyrosine phosphatase